MTPDGPPASPAGGPHSADRADFDAAFSREHGRLRRMVEARLDPRLRARFDAEDVLQEVALEAWTRIRAWLDAPTMPFFLWLRFLTAQRLAALARHHLDAHRRDARREAPAPRPGADSSVVAFELVGTVTRPSQAAARAETARTLAAALGTLPEADREILALRHFEQLSNAEAALELGLTVAATSKRYLRALARLRGVLEDSA